MVNKKPNKAWRMFPFWRNLFLYFLVFSIVGHVGELIWGLLRVALHLRTWESFLTVPLFALAVPYGLTAAMLYLSVYPLIQKKHIGLIMTFVIGAFIATVTEFLCAAVLVMFTGHNYFWDYSDRFMNLFGFVCLGNSVLFGLGSTVALRLIFPWTENLLKKVKQHHINLAFWLLFVGYILSQIWFRIIKG